MSVVINLSKKIQIQGPGEDKRNIHKYLPNFKWVLRDFSHDLAGKTPL